MLDIYALRVYLTNIMLLMIELSSHQAPSRPNASDGIASTNTDNDHPNDAAPAQGDTVDSSAEDAATGNVTTASGSALWSCDSDSGKNIYSSIVSGGNLALRHFVSNESEDINSLILQQQDVLNLSHIVDCITRFAGVVEGPPSIFDIPIFLRDDLKSAMGNELWMCGIVALTTEAYNDAYDALKNETVSGDTNSAMLRYILFCGTFIEDKLVDEQHEALIGSCQSHGLSDPQINTLRALLQSVQ